MQEDVNRDISKIKKEETWQYRVSHARSKKVSKYVRKAERDDEANKKSEIVIRYEDYREQLWI